MAEYLTLVAVPVDEIVDRCHQVVKSMNKLKDFTDEDESGALPHEDTSDGFGYSYCLHDYMKKAKSGLLPHKDTSDSFDSPYVLGDYMKKGEGGV